MASHAIFQYNVLAIDDTHNTWTNIIVKITILRLLGSSDDKEEIGVMHRLNRRYAPVKPTLGKLYSSVQWTQKAETRVLRRITDDA